MKYPLTHCESTNQAIDASASDLKKLKEVTARLKRWTLAVMLLNAAVNAGITAVFNMLDPH